MGPLISLPEETSGVLLFPFPLLLSIQAPPLVTIIKIR